jgi:hypothetical protein
LNSHSDSLQHASQLLSYSNIHLLHCGPSSFLSPVFQLLSSVPGNEQPSILLTRQYSGSEDIDLLEGIKSRIVTLDQEADVESIRPHCPSLFS